VLFINQPIVFDLVIILAGIQALREYYAMVIRAPGISLNVVGILGLIIIMLGARFDFPNSQIISLVAALWLGYLYFLFNFDSLEETGRQAGYFSLGHVYISLLLSLFISLHRHVDGYLWITFAAAVTFLADTAAFYVGRSVGRRPLYASVSPNKTVEGLAAGIAGGGLAALASVFILLPGRIFWYEAILLGMFLGFWGAIGDLFESMLKRSAGIKDSGGFLLGHGGILDRMDALLFNVPLVYIFVLYRIGSGS
ncbi:MAG: phosphatidate cytidylyltransferase, partial [Deltaproteobacteria bacterium]|nr:phosphatidate cytidylyltransferase [Deltaproteobacteria bacterium]